MKENRSIYPTSKVRCYVKRGKYYESPPSKVYYYVDIGGECIGVCDNRKSKYLLILVVLTLSVISILLYMYNNYHSYKTLGDEKLVGEDISSEIIDNEMLIRFNKYMEYSDGYVDIMIMNGNREVEVYIDGDKIKSEKIKLKPKEELLFLRVKLSEKSLYGDMYNTKLLVDTGQDKYEYDCVVENIENNKQSLKRKVDFSKEEVISDKRDIR